MTHRDRQTIEILNLREACGVMRNLLMDIAENEASLDQVNDRTPVDIKTKLVSSRDTRRRELCAEVDAVLESSVPQTSVDASLL
jgi:ACT domain-containing protein